MNKKQFGSSTSLENQNTFCISQKKMKAQAASAQRNLAFNEKINGIETLILAFKAQGIGCAHVHTSSNPHHEAEIPDEENQTYPLPPSIEAEDAEDCAIQVGKVGEIITSFGGALAIGPVLDLLLSFAYPSATDSPWFQTEQDLKISPAIFFLSLLLVIPAVYGAPNCHAQLEIASRIRNNFIDKARYAQKLLKWGLANKLEINDPPLTMPTIACENDEKAINKFDLISPTAATSLPLKQNIQIFGDVEQHFNEYVGLTIIAILRNESDWRIQLPLIITCLGIMSFACKPEVTTCYNTLVFMNEFNKGHIIKSAEKAPSCHWDAEFSAVAKIPAIFYANVLSFQQMCVGNLVAGIILAFCTTAGNIITQYFINKNTESHASIPAVAEVFDDRKSWEKLSFFGKGLVVARAIGTGNERSEPITIVIIAIMRLAGSPLSLIEEAGLAFALCFMGTLTAYSEARNAADHTARVGFFNQPLAISTENKSEDVLTPLI